ncbi:MAG: DNA polymerase-3 subunit beta [Candidatus Paceibacteria bacterium]|jgi:DNA polymerase-3 subunit beta
MKVECSREKLYEAVSKADKLTSKNATLPVLSCLLLEAVDSFLIVKSTNLDIGVEIKIPVKVLKEGIVAIPSSLLVSYISNLNSDQKLTLEVIKGTMFITNDKNESQIKTVSDEDFPSIPKLDSTKTFNISSDDLLKGLKSVWYGASTSSMKPELSSVYIYQRDDSVVFVATDSFRLAEKKVRVNNATEFESVLIPFKNVSEIIRIFDNYDTDIEVVFDKNQIALKADGIYIVSRIIDGIFPDYNQIIPKENSSEVVVLKQDLTQALKLSNIFSNKFNQVTMTVRPSDDVFEILAKDIDKGENRNTIQSTLRGDDIEINFNQRYIVDCFSSIESDSLTLYFNGAGKPMVIKGVGDGSFMYLVMPMNK